MNIKSIFHGRAGYVSAILALGAIAPTFAATVTKLSSDTFGQSGFTSGTRWSNNAVPSADNDYTVGGALLLRTPADTTANLVFAGNSLSILGAGSIGFKGTVDGVTVTINNLTMDNGAFNDIWDAVSATTTRTVTLAGNGITLGNGGGTFGTQTGFSGGFVNTKNIAVTAPISGAGKLTATNTTVDSAGVGVLTLSGTNTYTGGTTVNNLTQLVVQSSLGVGGNVSILTGGQLDLTLNTGLGFSQNLLLSSGLAANSITLNYLGSDTINTLSLDGGSTFLAPGVYGGIGSSADPSNQNALFSGTGTITVSAVPEPSAVVLMAVAGIVVLLFRRRLA